MIGAWSWKNIFRATVPPVSTTTAVVVFAPRYRFLFTEAQHIRANDIGLIIYRSLALAL